MRCGYHGAMPRKPFAGSLVLAAVLVSVAACSSGGGSSDPTTPGNGGTSSQGTTDTPAKTKLKKETGKGGIKNVFTKTSSGSKISLSAASPGHEVMEQIYDADTKTWSEPTSVFKDDTRFCHSIKLKSTGDIIAATVTCSISAQDKNGTQKSYVLASTDGTSWKRMDLIGAEGKPSLSPTGKYVAWTASSGFLLWNPTGGFTPVKYDQSSATPAIGVMRDDGSLVIIKALPQRHGNCIISFQGASGKAPTVKAINSTLPQPDHAKCVATSAHIQGAQIIANFTQTDTTKVNGKKVTKTTTFAYAFGRAADGHWIIKA
jgi:hypothetical protein